MYSINSIRMKTLLLSFLLFTICSIGLLAQTNNQIIKNPAFDLAMTERFKISKIEFTDSRTLVQLEWNIPEGWWIQYGADTFLRDPETGEKFTVIKIENEEFDTKIYIDSTKTHNSVFVFPPIDPGLEKIDYNDQFYGLYLNGKQPENSSEIPETVAKWLEEELSEVTTDPIKDFEDDQFFSKEPAKIIGYIKGYDSRVGFDTGIYYASNDLTREDYPIVIEIEDDGKFTGEIPLIHPVHSYLVVNNRMISFYLEPGQTLAMVLDWKDFLAADHYNNREYPQKSVEFKGKLAEINRELSLFQFPRFNYGQYQDNQLRLSPENFKEYCFNYQEENRKLLDSFISVNPISAKSETILRNENTLSGTTMVMNYLRERDYHERQDPENEFLQQKIGIEYYSFLKELPLNNQSYLVNKSFSEFINRFEYAEPLTFHANSKAISFTPEITAIEYFDLQNIPLTEQERTLLKPETFTSMEAYQTYREKRKPFDEKYSEELADYMKQYVEPYSQEPEPIDFMGPWKKKDSVMVNHLHLSNDLAYDITKTRSLKYDMDRITEADQAHAYWQELSATIENEFLKKEGERIVLNKFPKNEINPARENSTPKMAIKSEIIPLPEGKPKEFFYDIADQYKGKIVFVDFWATTCGPCVGTIKQMKDIRKKHKDNPDFEFVFITDQAQSPLAFYNKFTKEQEMENLHRVDTDIYNRFRQLFQFNGIPRYVVLNKNGEVIDGNFQMHNFSWLLPKILEKNK